MRSQTTFVNFSRQDCNPAGGSTGGGGAPLPETSDITQLYTREKKNPKLLHQATQLEALPQSWRDYFQQQGRLL